MNFKISSCQNAQDINNSRNSHVMKIIKKRAEQMYEWDEHSKLHTICQTKNIQTLRSTINIWANYNVILNLKI